MDIDDGVRLDVFALARNDDEAVRLAERRYRARTLAHWISDEGRSVLYSLVRRHQADEQVLGSPAFRVDSDRQPSLDDGARIICTAGHPPQHGGDKLMK